MSRKVEQISETRTLLTRMRNLLEERAISIPPSMKKDLEKQLDEHRKTMDLQLELEARELKEKKETLEDAFEILLDRREEMTKEQKEPFLKALNGLEKKIQEIETTNPEDIMADPDWA